MKKIFAIAMLLACAPFFAACNSSDNSPGAPPAQQNPQESKEVPQDEGGEVELTMGAEGTATVVIPPSSLSADATITVEMTGSTSGGGSGGTSGQVEGMLRIGPMIEVRATGLAGLLVTISGYSVSVPYDVQLAGNADVILMMQTGLGQPQPVSGAIAADGTLTADVFAFGTFWAAIEIVIDVTISGCQPQSGPPSGGTQVTITGSGFLAGDAEVHFGSELSASVQVISDTQVICVAPAHGSGSVDISVTIDGASAVLAGAFLYVSGSLDLILSGCNPPTSPPAGGIQVEISGSGFLAGGGDAEVRFDGSLAADIQVVSDVLITCTAPAHAEGTVDISVTVDGNTTVMLDAFVYAEVQLGLVLTSCNPPSGPPAGGTQVTITGQGFLDGTVTVMFGAEAAVSVLVLSNTQIICNAPAQAEATVDIIVTVGTSVAALVDAYAYVQIDVNVSGCTPDFGLSIGGTLVTISGSGFAQAQGGAQAVVMFGANAAANVQVLSDGSIVCQAPAGSGTVDVTVIIQSGATVIAQGTLQGAFTYN